MSDRRGSPVFTIPSHRSFADALAAGLIARFGKDPLGLAAGRILLPNNRAVRAVTEAFVRASGSGLLLPRLIPIGDPELDERIGGALDRDRRASRSPPAIDPLERTADAGLDRCDGDGSGREPAPGRGPRARRSTRCWSRRSSRAAPRRGRRDERARAALAEVAREAPADLRALARHSRAIAARSISPSGAIGCFARLAERVGERSAGRASLSPPASRPRRRRSRRWSPASRGCPAGMVVLPGLWLAERLSRRGVGRARSGRARAAARRPIRNST